MFSSGSGLIAKVPEGGGTFSDEPHRWQKRYEFRHNTSPSRHFQRNVDNALAPPAWRGAMRRAHKLSFQKEKEKKTENQVQNCLLHSGIFWFNEDMLKYILYCRKSTDEKDKQVLSIEAQIAELEEYASREQLNVVATLTESKTAKTPGREVFKQVLAKLESGTANAILSWHPDRLARNSVDGGYLIYLLDTGKLLDLKFPSFWFDNTPQGKFMLNIAFGQSKYYVDNLSENVKRGNRQKLRNGVWPNKAPLGYKNIVETKTIEIDPEKAKIVKKAFELFAEGKSSFTQIGKLMQKGGITSYSGKPIKIDQITRMLKKKFYI